MAWDSETRRLSAKTRQQRQVEQDRRVGPRIQALRAEGYGWRVVAKKLNDEGFRAPRGGVWHPHQVSRVARRLEPNTGQRTSSKRYGALVFAACVAVVSLFYLLENPDSVFYFKANRGVVYRGAANPDIANPDIANPDIANPDEISQTTGDEAVYTDITQGTARPESLSADARRQARQGILAWIECFDARSDADSADMEVLRIGIDCGSERFEAEPAAFTECFLEAARQGPPRAKLCLGTMYETGVGSLQKNAVEALAWTLVAAGEGDARANLAVQRMKDNMRVKDVKSGEDRALVLAQGRERSSRGPHEQPTKAAPFSAGVAGYSALGAPFAHPVNSAIPRESLQEG